LQPLGRQYNPDSAFRDLTRPAILKNTGVVIDPARYSKPLAKHTNEVRARLNGLVYILAAERIACSLITLVVILPPE
jgi:hypothetical protein